MHQDADSQKHEKALRAGDAILEAEQYSRRRWELSAAVFALLCLAGSGLYFFSEESVVRVLPAVLAGVLFIRRLMRRFVLEYLEQNSGEGVST